MFGIPVGKLLLAVFVGYMAYTMYVMYSIFKPPSCDNNLRCLQPFLVRKPKLGLQVSTSLGPHPRGSMTVIWKYDNFTVDQNVEKSFNVTLPSKTCRNGTLFVHAFLYPRGADPVSSYLTHDVSKITTYSLRQASYINLLGSGNQTDKNENNTSRPNKAKTTQESSNKPVTHWRQKLAVNVLEDDFALDRYKIPREIYQYIRISPDNKHYYPIVYIDEMSYRIKDLLPINDSCVPMPLTISYTPISIGKLRMWVSIKQSFATLIGLGFSETDTDEMKGIFADTNFYFLMLTFTVAAFHLLFDFLAFKNDISYWKNRETMVGLSTRVVVWRCLSTGVIFFYLWDENTSLLVLIPTGISVLIEIWKVTKAMKIKITWTGRIPSFEIGTASEKEKETEEFDSQAMKYLSYLLYPLCIAGAAYSLVYTPHKSWYSWCLNSLVNGVYAFGFLFMLPQLFVNYKLKSVAHLPWRAFMYKAFNTFIDDIFAFIITMPTAHRLACFRDDVVFLIYLYQRWLYPVDKTRANEFGVSYEHEVDKLSKKESKKTK